MFGCTLNSQLGVGAECVPVYNTVERKEYTVEIKACCMCQVEKPLTEYHKDKNKSDGRSARCAVCARAYMKKYRATPGFAAKKKTYEKERRRDPKGRSRIHAMNIRIKFGTSQEYSDWLVAIPNCHICRIVLGHRDGDERPQIDHDHLTGQIRGVLCIRCNTLVGTLEAEVAPAALTYIEDPPLIV